MIKININNNECTTNNNVTKIYLRELSIFHE